MTEPKMPPEKDLSWAMDKYGVCKCGREDITPCLCNDAGMDILSQAVRALQARLKAAEAERDEARRDLAGAIKMQDLYRHQREIECNRASAAESNLDQALAREKAAIAKVRAIELSDGEAREVVKDLLGMNPDASERMWFETWERTEKELAESKAREKAKDQHIKDLTDSIEILRKEKEQWSRDKLS